MIDAPFHAFNKRDIESALINDGVYSLYEGSSTIYIGKGEGFGRIQARLKAHKAGYEGFCTQKATYFNYELCYNPSLREVELPTEYKNLWGKLPECNDFIPSYSKT